MATTQIRKPQKSHPMDGPGWGGGYLPFDPEAQDDECLEPGDAAGG